jgi:PiT family inorganic phosphate transporter
MNSYIIFGILLALALLYNFLNGFHDAANVVATIIASRAMSARAALLLAAAANFVGPLIFGVAVATTIGKDLVDPSAITITALIAALTSANLWNIVTWWFGIPSSSSHALAGGLVGAALIYGGVGIIKMDGLMKIALALFLSPILGFIIGWILLKLTYWLARGASPKINTTFNRAQVLTATALALSHGTNDAQKAMGIIVMGLVTLGFQDHFYVPDWVIILSAIPIGLGTASGGWRIIHTLGGKFYRIRPVHSFTSQLASSLVIFGASFLGGPVSTTHVVSSTIVGVGAAERKSQVRWMNLTDIAIAWLITVPITALLAAILYPILRIFLGA